MEQSKACNLLPPLYKGQKVKVNIPKHNLGYTRIEAHSYIATVLKIKTIPPLIIPEGREPDMVHIVHVEDDETGIPTVVNRDYVEVIV